MMHQPDLPRWSIAIEAWRILIENTGAALRNALLPFLILLAMHRLTGIIEPSGVYAIGWHLLFVVVFPIPMALLLVPWYRLILSAQRPELAARPARGWYVAFMVRTLGLELIWFTFQMPTVIANLQALQGDGPPDPQLVMLGFMLFVVALVPSFYIYGRLALALPAAASGDGDGFRHAWHRTAEAGWRIAGIMFTVWFPFFVLGQIEAGAAAAGTAPPGFLHAAASAGIDVVRELAMAAALALVYAHYDQTRVEDVFS